MRKTGEILAITAVFVFGLLLGSKTMSYFINEPNDEPNCEPIYDTITITQWKPYYINHYKTDTLKQYEVVEVRDTLRDTTYIYPIIPISQHHFDTVLTTDSTTTKIKAVVSGFDVSMDSCAVEHTFTQIKPTTKRRRGIFWIGLGTGYALGITSGVLITK